MLMFVRHACIFLLVFLLARSSYATDEGVDVVAPAVAVDGVMQARAMLTVNGTSRFYSVGQTVAAGVRLLAVESGHVVLEIDGKKLRVAIGQRTPGASPASRGEQLVTLYADQKGHFVANGRINGVPARFVVDTGATLVFMGRSDARRFGLDKLPGSRGSTQTANGTISVTRVHLREVSIGDITLMGVDAAFSDEDMPVILLGMSFLSRTEMKTEGSSLKLKKLF